MAAPTAASSAHLTLRGRPKPPPFLHRLPPTFPRFIPSAGASISASRPLSVLLSSRSRSRLRTLVVSEEEEIAVVVTDDDDVEEEEEEEEEEGDVGEGFPLEVVRTRARPCELYVCNLPRSCDIPQLLELFKPYGTVISVEVSRDSETGKSRGCGFVTMGSIPEAKAAISALDVSDLEGREIRVKFSVEMISGRTNIEALNSPPNKDMVFESPHKVYVGNLAWSVRPDNLREYFSQFGTVVSSRVLHDRKGGKNRVYGFISFSSADEVKAAIEASGSVYQGRILLVRGVVNRE